MFQPHTDLALSIFGTEHAFVWLNALGREHAPASAASDATLDGLLRDELFNRGEPLAVADLAQDVRFREHPSVVGAPTLRFLAAAPVRLASGALGGALCLAGPQPREFTRREIEILQQLASLISREFRAVSPATAAPLESSTGALAREFAEATVRTMEARAAAFFEHALDGMITIDHTERILELNPAAERMFGLERSAAVGQSWFELILPPARRDAHRRRLAVGEPPILDQRTEGPALRGDGEKILVELAVTRIPIQDPPLYTIHLRDITERRAAENRMRMLESSVFHANDAILITEAEPVDEPGPRIIYVNRAFTEMTGYTAEEVLGKTPRILQGPRTDPAARRKIREALEDWKPVRVELVNYRKDGTEFSVELAIVPVANQKGWYTHWVSVQRDNSEARQAREALVQARDDAQRANTAKSDFLSRMSHELRTPLNAILGFSQLLEKAQLAPRDRRGLEQIVKAGWHLLTLINEVLDLARIESGQISFSAEPVQASHVIREAMDLIAPLAASAKVTLDAKVDVDELIHVHADRQRLKQILLNLFSNAIKYNHPGGSVRVVCEEPSPGWLKINVIDTGPGIAEKDLEKLFAPFERLGAPSSIEGTGLGLALSKRLVEAMGGQLTVASSAPNGSTFSIALPRVEQPAAFRLAPRSLPAEEAPNAAPATLLLIEDNLANLQLIEFILAERPSVTLLPAMQGKLGLELAREHIPDLVLLDLHLPDLDGAEVLRRLRLYPETREIPVIIVSADATPGQIERLNEAGAQGYITKPIDVESFLATLDTYLRNKPLTAADSLQVDI